MWTDTWPMCRSRCVGQQSDRHISRYVGRHADRHISIDTSAESRSICRLTYRSSIGGYVDWQSTDMSVEMSTDISVEGFVNYTWSLFSNFCQLSRLTFIRNRINEGVSGKPTNLNWPPHTFGMKYIPENPSIESPTLHAFLETLCWTHEIASSGTWP